MFFNWEDFYFAFLYAMVAVFVFLDAVCFKIVYKRLDELTHSINRQDETIVKLDNRIDNLNGDKDERG